LHLDGQRVRLALEGLRAFAVGDVKAVEIYPRESETPSRFHRSDAPCGAIVLWTKID
jgi:hypothetical protein